MTDEQKQEKRDEDELSEDDLDQVAGAGRPIGGGGRAQGDDSDPVAGRPIGGGGR